MKYFVCAFDSILLGIPTEQTQRIIPVTRKQTSAFETDSGEAFISIPALLNRKEVSEKDAAVHGLVLKSGLNGGNCPEKITLLLPKIDIDIEIPEENIHRLPAVFSGSFSFFKGACFTENSNKIIFILDTEKLIDKYGAGSGK